MANKIKSMAGIVNPFSEAFMETWELWLNYKWEVFKFKYKGTHSEQVKLIQLHELAKGDETEAREIILQSIGEQWSGLFLRKNITNGTEKTATRENVNQEFANRNYSNR